MRGLIGSRISIYEILLIGLSIDYFYGFVA